MAKEPRQHRCTHAMDLVTDVPDTLDKAKWYVCSGQILGLRLTLFPPQHCLRRAPGAIQVPILS